MSLTIYPILLTHFPNCLSLIIEDYSREYPFIDELKVFVCKRNKLIRYKADMDEGVTEILDWNIWKEGKDGKRQFVGGSILHYDPRSYKKQKRQVYIYSNQGCYKR